MKIAIDVLLTEAGTFAKSKTCARLRRDVRLAIRSIGHPAGSDAFTIFPESGKKRGKGNGVGPIKRLMMDKLAEEGWTLEGPAKNAFGKKLGEFDAVKIVGGRVAVIEWETGNVSSSHRSLNKMSMLISKGIISLGILVVPTKNLARFLTDRIGNFEELSGYWEFWSAYPCQEGVLEVIGIEQDSESLDVPRLRKMTDGRASG